MSTSPARGLFVTIEGPDGSGKTTLIAALEKALEATRVPVLRTREPGGAGSVLAEAIRCLVLTDWDQGMPPMTELLLMVAARHAHLAHTVGPALARGDVVLCDRFTDSTWAYQGARGVSDDVLAELEARVPVRPDLTLLLDLPPEAQRERLAARGAQDRFDREPEAFRAMVARRFKERAAADPERVLRIPATLRPDTVLDCAYQTVCARMGVQPLHAALLAAAA